MSPSAGCSVHDLDSRWLAFERLHVPKIPLKPFIVLADCRTDNLTVHQQVDARLPLVTTSPNKEVDEFS